MVWDVGVGVFSAEEQDIIVIEETSIIVRLISASLLNTLFIIPPDYFGKINPSPSQEGLSDLIKSPTTPRGVL
jgi:hypothetical protein